MLDFLTTFYGKGVRKHWENLTTKLIKLKTDRATSARPLSGRSPPRAHLLIVFTPPSTLHETHYPPRISLLVLMR